MERVPIRRERRQRQMPIINVWVILAVLIIACILLLLTFALLLIGRAGGSPSQSTAILQVIPAASMTPTSQITMNPVPSSETTLPAPPEGVISIGSYVQVTGTEGTGLRLRDQPGLKSDVLLVASEAEVFRVDDGPDDMDGYTWWHLVGPFDPSREGWAVSNFLQSVQNP
jgi:signal peptidase I